MLRPHACFLAGIATLAFSPDAHALAITSASCTMQATNSLRFDCSVTVDGAADVWVAFCEDTGGACAYNRFTPNVTRASAGTVSLTMYGMAASQAYDWRAVAKQGATTVTTARAGMTTGALPSEMDDIALTAWGTADAVRNVMFNYGCHDPVDPDHDWIVISDTSGRVVWYENPEDTVGAKKFVTALNVSRPDKHILAVLDHEYVIEYALSGEVVKLYCKDDPSVGGLQCVDAVSADKVFDEYVHHDVHKENGRIWVLTAEEQIVPDADNCDAVSATYPIIVDGVYAFRTSDDALVEEWDMSEAYTHSYTDATCTSCSAGYWGGRLTGCDWGHANGLWVDAAKQWTFSQKHWNRLVSVDGNPTSGTYRDLDWELEGDGVGGDYALVSSGSYTSTFDNQHAPMWTAGDTTLLFDNHTAAAPNDTRGIEIDWSTGDADIVGQYTMESPTGSGLNCLTGGAVMDVTGGNIVAFCVGSGTDDRPVFNEFDGIDSVVWGLKAACPAGQRSAPSYRGYPNLW
jgi:hypothetical protein